MIVIFSPWARGIPILLPRLLETITAMRPSSLRCYSQRVTTIRALHELSSQEDRPLLFRIALPVAVFAGA